MTSLFKRIEEAYSNDESEVIKALDQLIQIIQIETSSNSSVEKVFMFYRVALMFMVSDKLSWDWKKIFESLMLSFVPLLD